MASHIMVINDSQEILDMVGDLLTGEGYEVSLYVAPDLAVLDFAQIRPDLIILDWMFGREDLGMQMLQRLKLRPSTMPIPVVVCTAAVRSVQEVESFLRAKGVGVIFKPFTVDDLLSAIATALQGATSTDTRNDESAFLDRLGRLTPSAPRRGGQA